MTTRLPQELGKWSVSHAGGLFGTLKRAENVNFDQEGYVTPSPKSVSIYGSATDADFDLPLEILYFNSKYFILTADDIWELSNDLLFTSLNDTETGEPSTNRGSDAVIWQSKVYISGDVDGDVKTWDGSSFATPGSGIAISDNAYPHPLAVMGNFSNGNLVVGQKNIVTRHATDHSTSATLTLNSDYIVTCLLYRQNYLYIGTKTLNGSEAKVFVWSGAGTAAQQEYSVGADWVFSMCEYGNSFAAVTSAGQILQWNGAGFDSNNPLANFPVFYSKYRWTNNPGSLIGRVHMRGMKADGDLLYININGSVAERQEISGTTDGNGFYLSNQPSGLWCYDPKVGLYCRQYSTTDGYQSLTASALSSNTLTLSAAIQAKTGDPILVFENGSLTGVNDDTVYYIIRVSSTEVKLASTRRDALAGTALTLGGSVTSATFRVVSYDQHGEPFSWDSDPGGVGLVQADSGDPPILPRIFASQVLWGFEDRSSNTYLNCSTAGAGIGHLEAVRVLSRNVMDTWKSIYTTVFNLFMGYDKVITRAAWRSRHDLPSPPIVGTYSSDSVIGSASELLDLAEVGDTVVIVSGDGGGERRKISAINGDELTLSEAVTGADSASTVVFYIDGAKEYQSSDNTSSNAKLDYVKSPLGDGAASPFIDVSLELRGGVSVPEVIISHSKHTEII